MKFQFEFVRDVKTPIREHSHDAGIDVFIPNDFETTTLEWGDSILIPMGIKVRIEENTALKFVPRSSVASKHGLICGARLIECNYRGELFLNLIKTTKGSVTLEKGMKISQLLHIPYISSTVSEVESVTALDTVKSERGENGFGSTGI